MDFLSDLNAAQREAVIHGDGPLLVLAGAGSGKTRIITRRIVYLISQGVAPRQILAITFTNKAAGEMQQRVEQLVPGHGVWVSTFHRFCAKLLRMYGEEVGLREGYVIYDTPDRLRLIKEAMQEAEVDRPQVTLDLLEQRISRAKNELLDPDAYQGEARDYLGAHVARVYRLYQDKLLKANAADFDDLLLHTATLLKRNPGLRAELDARYRYVLVDEYQDTNLAQYAIVRGLSVEHPHLCVTGDPDQSIYGWRGADLNNILQFESDFPGASVVRLEKNYRSTQRIVAAASHLIQFNRRRKPKELITDNPEGEPVMVMAYADEVDEARSIASRIRDAVNADKKQWGDFAVFCRVGALTRPLEMAFRAEGVPYQVLSGVGFFERAEVKDLLAYLKLLVNPYDDVSFTRVVNVPPRGVGTGTLGRLRKEAELSGQSLLGVARRVKEISTIRPRQAESIVQFVQLIDEFAALQGHPVEELMRQVLERTQYVGVEQGGPEAEERLANVEELLTAARQYDQEHPDGDLNQFLTESVLMTDLDTWDTSKSAVALMTLHAAKGLEFAAVYIIAVEEGILPHQRVLDQDQHQEALEEERRLLFVGMTRAKEGLHLSYVHHRHFRGSQAMAIPSHFLGELAHEPSGRKRTRRPPAGGLIQSGAELAGEVPQPRPATGQFAVGMLVRHPDYGLGHITSLSGFGQMRKATVRFTLGGERTFVLTRAKLQPVKAS